MAILDRIKAAADKVSLEDTVDAGSNVIENVGEPQNDADVARKTEVDSAETNANDYTDTTVSSHNNNNTGVHGVGSGQVLPYEEVESRSDIDKVGLFYIQDEDKTTLRVDNS